MKANKGERTNYFLNSLKQYIILFIGFNYDEIKIIFVNEILYFFSLKKKANLPVRTAGRNQGLIDFRYGNKFSTGHSKY
jgi:hypothetical protein